MTYEEDGYKWTAHWDVDDAGYPYPEVEVYEWPEDSTPQMVKNFESRLRQQMREVGPPRGRYA